MDLKHKKQQIEGRNWNQFYRYVGGGWGKCIGVCAKFSMPRPLLSPRPPINAHTFVPHDFISCCTLQYIKHQNSINYLWRGPLLTNSYKFFHMHKKVLLYSNSHDHCMHEVGKCEYEGRHVFDSIPQLGVGGRQYCSKGPQNEVRAHN